MKHIAAFLCIFVSGIAFAVDGDHLHGVCIKTPPEEKFVFKLYSDHGMQVCSLAAFQENGETCEDNHGGMPSWGEIVDLNGDGYFDLVVSYFSGGMWRGDQQYFVFLNCGNDTFVKILEDSFTYVGSTKTVSKNGMLELTALRAEYIGEDKHYLQRYTLKFDTKKSEYVIAPIGRKFIMTEEAEKEWATKDAPKNFTNWDTFPARLP